MPPSSPSYEWPDITSLAGIAAALNDRGIPTASGEIGAGGQFDSC
jgi:hypothetical protein